MKEDFESLILAFEASKTKLWEVFSASDEELVRRVNRSVNEIRRFREYYAHTIDATPVGICKPESQLSTGMSDLDEALNGGLMKRSVTEISGPAGAGKTCICCQMAVMHSESCVYFCIEETVSMLCRRMKDMLGDGGSNGCKFKHIKSLAELRIGLNVLKRSKIRPSLVIIDSIAAALGPSSNSHEVEIKLEELNLRRLAYDLDAAVVITNQVRDSQRPPPGLPSYHYHVQELLTDGDVSPRSELRKRPLYGLQMAKHINTRVLISRPSTLSKDREMHIIFSKWAAPSRVWLTMTPAGLVTSNDEDDDLEGLTRASSEPLTPTSI